MRWHRKRPSVFRHSPGPSTEACRMLLLCRHVPLHPLLSHLPLPLLATELGSCGEDSWLDTLAGLLLVQRVSNPVLLSNLRLVLFISFRTRCPLHCHSSPLKRKHRHTLSKHSVEKYQLPLNCLN